jgi:hypothetical protein
MRVLRCGGASDVEITSRDELLRRSSHCATMSKAAAAAAGEGAFVLTDDNIWDDDALNAVQCEPLRMVVWRMEYLVHVITTVGTEQQDVVEADGAAATHQNPTIAVDEHRSGGAVVNTQTKRPHRGGGIGASASTGRLAPPGAANSGGGIHDEFRARSSTGLKKRPREGS